MRSFSISLCPGVSINCAISGTSWIDRRLEAFEFNKKIRFQTVEARLRAAPEREISSLVMGRELNCRTPGLSQCLRLSPLNKPAGDYDDIMVDDERIVGVRSKSKVR